MQVISSIITAGVAILAIALVTYAVGKTFMSLPQFQMSGSESVWNDTMQNISTNAKTAFSLLGISPLVIGVGLIISILVGAFAYMYQAG